MSQGLRCIQRQAPDSFTGQDVSIDAWSDDVASEFSATNWGQRNAGQWRYPSATARASVVQWPLGRPVHV